MKIIYRQLSPKNDTVSTNRILEEIGINNCYFKRIFQELSDNSNTKKRHSHTAFEIHMITKGSQTYESDVERYVVKAGEFLMIPPNKSHKMIDSEYPVEKYAVMFSCESRFFENFGLFPSKDCFRGTISRRIGDLFASIEEEYAWCCPGREMLIGNSVFEVIVCLMRECCGNDVSAKKRRLIDTPPSDERVELAKQYISDNIEEPLQVGEVAAYCYLSEKHLTRLFEADVGMTVSSYIRSEKIKHIELMLADPGLTLAAISETMGFPTESGFNAFFKKNNGMPPGEYRKMIISGKT